MLHVHVIVGSRGAQRGSNAMRGNGGEEKDKNEKASN